MIQVVKVQSDKKTNSLVEPLKKIGFLAQFFSKPNSEASNDLRYITFYEGRLLVIKELQGEHVRNYGSHFSVKDKDKL